MRKFVSAPPSVRLPRTPNATGVLFLQLSRVSELERARDDLTARVDEANAREQQAGDRVSVLEEEVAEAKAALRETE